MFIATSLTNSSCVSIISLRLTILQLKTRTANRSDRHQSCMLEVLDTAGQEEYIALRDQWIRDGEGFVLVYSISSRSSFTRIQKFYNQIQRVKEAAAAGSPTFPGSPLSQTMGNQSLGPAPVMLVGNKCDRVTEREVSTQEGSALAKQLNCEFVEAFREELHQC